MGLTRPTRMDNLAGHLDQFRIKESTMAEDLKIPIGEDHTDEGKESLGDELTINFKLPSGETAQHTARMAHTVEYLKLLLQEKHGLAFGTVNLKKGDKTMIDPLSLADFSIEAGSTVDIDVVNA